MHDGQADEAVQGLVAHPVGVVVFAVVANKSLGLSTSGLTPAALGQIFGASPNIGYRAVGRDNASGTRETFENNVLHHDTDFPTNATCPVVTAATPAMFACDEPTTMDLLTYINQTPSAIGYAPVVRQILWHRGLLIPDTRS
jgi:ABC-type phosphate transport system substrate-binding protein